MVIFIAMAVCFVAASFVTFIVNEKTSKVSTRVTCKIMFQVNSKNTRTSVFGQRQHGRDLQNHVQS